jgi:flagellar hook-basal body complex protein FliE
MDINSAYNNAISNVTPGTFVPDVAPGVKTTPIPDDSTSGAAAVGSFSDTLKGYLSDVNDKLATSDQLQQDLATGKTNDLNKVITSTEEAGLSMQFTLAMRNKLLDAYKEISQMQM